MKHDLGDGDLCDFPDQTSPHGRKYKMGGKQWCAHSDHYRPEGARKMAFTPKEGTSPLDDEKPAKRFKATKPKADAAPAAVKAPKVFPLCADGCGNPTRGGRFLPGHDARLHSRINALEAQGLGHDEALVIAGKGPLTGKYLKAAEEAKAPKKAPKPVAAE